MEATTQTQEASHDQEFLKLAREEAENSLTLDGLPTGSVLVIGNNIIGKGHNQRVQKGDPTAHGTIECLRNAGRQRSYKGSTLYTTLSPCMMCAGAIIQFGISRVIIGENKTFGGNEELLRSKGVEVVVLDDPECKRLITKFIKKHSAIWHEHIGQVSETHTHK